MNFSYNWLQSFFKEKLPEPKKLAELITLRFFEVEAIEKKENDWAIDIDVLPNRAGDCFSHIGIAREISAITNLKLNDSVLKRQALFQHKTAETEFCVDVKNKDDCPRYTAALIENIKVGPSPSWIKEPLETCGLKPINNIVDIVNYVMLETGQPMHAFDFHKIASGKIIVRRAKKNEKVVSLDNKEYSLDETTLVISDTEKTLGVAGIKGGKNTEIDDKTVSLVLESANFNRIVTRKSSTKLKLRTDASLRFEHGIDPNLTEEGIKRAVDLIGQIAGGKMTKLIDYYPVKRKKQKIKFDLEYTNRLLGINIKKPKAKKILTDLGFNVSGNLEVEIPTRRLDVNCHEDLIEEIGRIYGYERIEPFLPQASIVPPLENRDVYWGKEARRIFKNIGFCEVYNHSFISQEQSEIFNYDSEKLMEVEKPVSLDQKYLRPSLVPHLLKNVKNNEKTFKDFKLFELGKVFAVNEKEELAGIITGDSFYHIKGAIEVLLDKLGVEKVRFIDFPEKSTFLHLNKRAKILSKFKEIGFIGNISLKILEDLKIKSDVSVFVIDFEKIKKIASKDICYRQIAKFPETIRDLSVIVPEKERFENILNVIKSVKTDLIEKVDLFDVYQGKEISGNKKSLALRFIYRDDKKTLTADEVNLLHEKIIKKIDENSNWQVRK